MNMHDELKKANWKSKPGDLEAESSIINEEITQTDSSQEFLEGESTTNHATGTEFE